MHTAFQHKTQTTDGSVTPPATPTHTIIAFRATKQGQSDQQAKTALGEFWHRSENKWVIPLPHAVSLPPLCLTRGRPHCAVCDVSPVSLLSVCSSSASVESAVSDSWSGLKSESAALSYSASSSACSLRATFSATSRAMSLSPPTWATPPSPSPSSSSSNESSDAFAPHQSSKLSSSRSRKTSAASVVTKWE